MTLTFWAAKTLAASNLLGVGEHTLLLNATLAPPLLPPVFNKPTAITLSGKIVASFLVSGFLINPGLVLMLPLRSGWLR
jgi:hypothetical protein